MKLSDLTDFPVACARLASWAAERVWSGALPPVGDDGSGRPCLYSISIREDEIAVIVRSPRFYGDDQAYCHLGINGDLVTCLWGLTPSGVKYWLMGATVYAVQGPCVFDAAIDCGERDVIPAIADWAHRHHIQVSPLVRVTAEAATITPCAPAPLEGNNSPSAALVGN